MWNNAKIAEYAFLYIFVGSIAVMCNIIVMIVQLKNRQSLSNSFSIMILASGDVIFSCGLISSAFDRFLAIKYYVWYFNNQASNVKRHLTCGLIIFIFALCSLSCMIFTTDLTKPVSPLCFPSDIFNVYQATYHYCLNATVGFLSSIVIFSSISAFVKIRRKNSVSPINFHNNNNNNNTDLSSHSQNNSWSKDFHLTLSMLIIGSMEIFLVVTPNLLLATLAYQFYDQKLSTLKAINFSAGLLIGFRSMMSLPVHLAVNKDFRDDFFKCVGIYHSAN
uniref:G-protein coupled receptors family 1 profile domain-containing protein n=1 Tax=Romanomermis culicivorax TaxID=13658 RepID=A0A915K457_ROMCU